MFTKKTKDFGLVDHWRRTWLFMQLMTLWLWFQLLMMQWEGKFFVFQNYRINCVLGLVGTYRSKEDRWWLALCINVSYDLDGGGEWQAALITGEMCWSLLLGPVFLNLGSGNFKFHDIMSRQGSEIKYAEWLNSEMKEVTVCGVVRWILITLTCRF